LMAAAGRRVWHRAAEGDSLAAMARPRLDELLPPIAKGLLRPDEEMLGCCVATWQKTFSGRMVAIAVADDRIVVQPLNNKFAAAGEPIDLPRSRIAKQRVEAGVATASRWRTS